MNNDYPFPDQCEKCIHSNVCYMVGECLNHIPGFECDCFEAKRPRGEWIKESLQIDEHHFRSYAKCKACECSFKPYSFAVKEFDFCPKCGADMRKVRKGG